MNQRLSTHKHWRRLIEVALVFLALFGPQLAFAQPAPDTEARFAEAKRRGDEAMDARRPQDALTAYIEAYAIKPDPVLLFNKGRALQMLGDYPQAMTQLESFEKEASPELLARVPGLQKMLADLRQRVTTIVIACDVDGAEIRVRDRPIGKCPLRNPYVALAGDAKIDVLAEGYFPWKRELPLPPGGVAAVEVHLVSKVSSGLLVVKSTIPAAIVVVDGNRAGNAPIELSVTKGAHAIEVSRDGYKPAKVETTVDAGQTREVTVPLERESSILTRWWFWTGIGVLAAGGITLGIVLTAEKDPTPGTLGVVSGGLHF